MKVTLHATADSLDQVKNLHGYLGSMLAEYGNCFELSTSHVESFTPTAIETANRIREVWNTPPKAPIGPVVLATEAPEPQIAFELKKGYYEVFMRVKGDWQLIGSTVVEDLRAWRYDIHTFDYFTDNDNPASIALGVASIESDGTVILESGDDSYMIRKTR